MNKKGILAAVILIMVGVAGLFYYNQSTKTVTVSVDEYEIDDRVGEEITEGMEKKEELIDTVEEEVPVDKIEEMEERSSEQKEETIETLDITGSQSNGLDSIKTKSSAGVVVHVDEKSLGLEGKQYYYYYNKLDTNGKNIYRQILACYLNHFDSFDILVAAKDFSNYNHMVLFDHPEIFWVESSYRYRDFGTYTEFIPEYNRTENEVARDQKKLDEAVKKALKDAPKKGSDYEKTKYVFTYLIDKVDYKLNVADNQNIYSALVNRITVCAGYAKATQYLLQKMGVRSIYVCGMTDRGYHAWNIIKCGDNYYQVDTTWGDPTYLDKNTNIPKVLQYNYAYLCVDDESMYQSRTVDSLPGVPSCKSKKLYFYPKNNRYFKTYGDDVKKSIRKNLKAGKSYWHGQFSKDAYKKMKNACKDGLYSKLVYDVKGKNKQTWYWTFDDSNVVKLYY